MFAMRLRDWRQQNSQTMQVMADLLGLANPSVYQKYETGQHRTDAPIVERIAELTSGAVTAQDMHETRLEWLNRKNGMPPADATVTEKARADFYEETIHDD